MFRDYKNEYADLCPAIETYITHFKHSIETIEDRKMPLDEILTRIINRPNVNFEVKKYCSNLLCNWKY